MFPYGIDTNGNTIYDKSKLKNGTITTRVSDILEPSSTIDENSQ